MAKKTKDNTVAEVVVATEAPKAKKTETIVEPEPQIEKVLEEIAPEVMNEEPKQESKAIEEVKPQSKLSNLFQNTKIDEVQVKKVNPYETIQFKAAQPNSRPIVHKPLKFDGYTWNGSFID